MAQEKKLYLVEITLLAAPVATDSGRSPVENALRADQSTRLISKVLAGMERQSKAPEAMVPRS